ncbi:hypothetical protein IE81DRAFT_344524 [Ceraceosorus guamensis]|uniref:PH domain-containing protein n=1 Tax=Ceraceosorus guamensis TaxID=1522189 RepID=A0A316W6R1_9BASI|nr:hypothetical protein IE81DRAFT_344524 [Ceraceosorus guamensis]PWN45626.1 hypothetical protein IE81DRAFT_344524 [Ceraceosorus guamensis]
MSFVAHTAVVERKQWLAAERRAITAFAFWVLFPGLALLVPWFMLKFGSRSARPSIVYTTAIFVHGFLLFDLYEHEYFGRGKGPVGDSEMAFSICTGLETICFISAAGIYFLDLNERRSRSISQEAKERRRAT